MIEPVFLIFRQQILFRSSARFNSPSSVKSIYQSAQQFEQVAASLFNRYSFTYNISINMGASSSTKILAIVLSTTDAACGAYNISHDIHCPLI